MSAMPDGPMPSRAQPALDQPTHDQPADAQPANNLDAPVPLPGTSVAITVADRAALEAAVAERLAARQGFALATVNLDHLVKLRHDPAFRTAYAAHDLVVADGNPIVWLARLSGRRVGLVPGADLVRPLARLAREAGVSVALVGATEAVLDAAAEALDAAEPGLAIAARIAPGQNFDPEGAEAEAVIAALRESGAGLCLLALGAPRQERLAARARKALPACGFAALGAWLDFVAGSQQRAPVWVRRLALEWAWRLAREPGRLAGRYLGCALLLPRLLVAALLARLGERRA